MVTPRKPWAKKCCRAAVTIRCAARGRRAPAQLDADAVIVRSGLHRLRKLKEYLQFPLKTMQEHARKRRMTQWPQRYELARVCSL